MHLFDHCVTQQTNYSPERFFFLFWQVRVLREKASLRIKTIERGVCINGIHINQTLKYYVTEYGLITIGF